MTLATLIKKLSKLPPDLLKKHVYLSVDPEGNLFRRVDEVVTFTSDDAYSVGIQTSSRGSGVVVIFPN